MRQDAAVFSDLRGRFLAPVHRHHAGENVVQAALLRVEQAHSRIGKKMTKENQNSSAWKAAIRGDTLPPNQVAPFEAHQALADGRRVRSANGERVIAKADDGKDGPNRSQARPRVTMPSMRHHEHSNQSTTAR